MTAFLKLFIVSDHNISVSTYRVYIFEIHAVFDIHATNQAKDWLHLI